MGGRERVEIVYYLHLRQFGDSAAVKARRSTLERKVCAAKSLGSMGASGAKRMS